jgi:hypothetical protein
MDEASEHALDERAVVSATQLWLERAVIGLGLCPFAKAVHVKGQIRFRVSPARTRKALRAELSHELTLLSLADPEELDTTLLIHPWVLREFLDYNDFLAIAEATLDELNLSGELQIASFHPDYQFANNASDDMANYSNRSPYPILHLLREASVDRAVLAFPDPALIFGKNIETLRALGHRGWHDLMSGAHEPPKADAE